MDAVTPPPDGGYPEGNTAEGDDALLSLGSGSYDTAIGFLSLWKNDDGNFNTAIGAGALLRNTSANENTATGAGALLNNASPFLSDGDGNTANGAFSLFKNSTGSFNTAIGDRSLFNNTSSSNNIALGDSAGSGVTTASHVICIGSPGKNVNNCTFISNVISSVTSDRVVYIGSDGKLGTLASSRRYKDEVKPMDNASEAILALKPVTVRYKQEVDSTCAPQFGLEAEEVAQVNPDLVTRDEKGEIYSVRYDQVNAMLLNEFLKEHKKVEDQQAAIAELNLIVARQVALITQQQKGLEAITARVAEQGAQLQKVLGLIQMSQGAPQVVSNKP